MARYRTHSFISFIHPSLIHAITMYGMPPMNTLSEMECLKTTCIISSFCGRELGHGLAEWAWFWAGLPCLRRLQSRCWPGPQSHWRFDGLRIHFQRGPVTWLLAGGLSSSARLPLHRLHEWPRNMAARSHTAFMTLSHTLHIITPVVFYLLESNH